MKLYWGKHTCAIGIHIVLEELGAPYELEEVDVQGGATHRPPFSELNPKGKVPVLVRDDGSVLTEYAAVAGWLAARFRDRAELLPFEDLEGQTKMYEAMDYIVGHIHALAFPRIFFPERFAPAAKDDPAVAEAVKAQGRSMAEEGFAIVGRGLGEGPWLAGDRFTIGDTALFYAARWAPEVGVALPVNVADHLRRTKARPAVARVMQAWGES